MYAFDTAHRRIWVFEKGGAKTEIARMPVHFARMADYFSHIFSEVMVKDEIYAGEKNATPIRPPFNKNLPTTQCTKKLHRKQLACARSASEIYDF